MTIFVAVGFPDSDDFNRAGLRHAHCATRHDATRDDSRRRPDSTLNENTPANAGVFN
ncbi:hypothetical protein [Paraburkholderia sp. SOS3]|jgi:hypothetical protein|uniref:hypothetical protein n=1 Tax=Paraburkholderia sp. SOS3 TaxID=1926494 RepID=UPI0012EB1D4D|nr:hypothetical protein [Paraburkholderia sp. SOS3]